MAELKIYLLKSLNERFRRIAMSVHGYGRGSLSKAAEEALAKWCSEHEHSIQENADIHSETTHDQPSSQAESHDPDERSHVHEAAEGVAGNQSLHATGARS